MLAFFKHIGLTFLNSTELSKQLKENDTVFLSRVVVRVAERKINPLPLWPQDRERFSDTKSYKALFTVGRLKSCMYLSRFLKIRDKQPTEAVIKK